MSDGSSIEWTDASWNPIRGCDKVSAGCKNCYAETFAERWRGIKGHPFEQGFDLRLVPEALDKPLCWKKPRKIFVNSMSDLFHEGIPFDYIDQVFGVMWACRHLGSGDAVYPGHVFQVLTKRAARMREYFAQPEQKLRERWAHQAVNHGGGNDPDSLFDSVAFAREPHPRIHLGVSAENQATADERIPLLLQCPAAVRWVSAEPLLGATRLDDITDGAGGVLKPLVGLHWVPTSRGMELKGGKGPAISWVVAGGESGPGARPCDLSWIRSIVEQCKAADVPAFVKQLGARPLAHTRWDMSDEQFRINDAAGWTEHDGPILLRLSKRKGGDLAEFPEDLRVREFPRSAP